MVLHDRYAKTVRIPVRIENGNIQYFYGGALPELKGVVIGDLVVPSHSVTNLELLKKLNDESEKLFLEKGSTVLVNVRPSFEEGVVKPADAADKYLEAVREKYFSRQQPNRSTSPSFPLGFSSGKLAEVTLLEDLLLLMRGTKPPCLGACRCRIPYLDTEVESLNQAYSRLSEVFEPHRRSHTGSVFTLCYYHDGDLYWQAFDSRRLAIESEYEAASFCGSQC